MRAQRFILLFSAVAAVAALWLGLRPGPRASGPLPHSAYVWQRAWNGSVSDAVGAHAGSLEGLLVLTAEVGWQQGHPAVVRVPIDYAALGASGKPIGLALRIDPFAGPFRAEDETSRYLADLGASLVTEASNGRLAVAELQIDFDCAESKLAGYHLWVEAIRKRLRPVPVTITALPSWLGRYEFRGLVAACDGFVVRVHSLDRPQGFDTPFTLCRPDAARQAVERAARLGRPFRVALPSYGYRMAFDPQDRFRALGAEGPTANWPTNAQIREVRADAEALAELVASWSRDRPPELTGLIWYWLPVEGDHLSWRWPTFAAVMAGSVPHPALRAEGREATNGLVDVVLANVGPADCPWPVQIVARWQAATLIAADGLNGFEVQTDTAGSARFRSKSPSWRLAAAEQQTVGWLRLSTHAPIEFEVQRPSPDR
jgi:hypothetical protein